MESKTTAEWLQEAFNEIADLRDEVAALKASVKSLGVTVREVSSARVVMNRKIPR